MELKIKKINSGAFIPHYAKDEDCGLDLSSVEEYIIESGKKIIVSTGLIMKIPKGYFGSIREPLGTCSQKRNTCSCRCC